MKVTAFLNFGRWLVRCPKHPKSGILEVDPKRDSTFVCPVCYPGSIKRFTVIRGGKVEHIFDQSAQRTARMEAQKNGDIYEIEYPEEV